jgi:hypothetical protein
MDMRVDVDNGTEFFAEEVSVTHSPLRVVLDFKRMIPRLEASNEPRMVLKHSVIMLDPYFAKELLRVLKDNLEKYEKKFGQIKRPDVLKKAEKSSKREGKKPARQDYFG